MLWDTEVSLQHMHVIVFHNIIRLRQDVTSAIPSRLCLYTGMLERKVGVLGKSFSTITAR